MLSARDHFARLYRCRDDIIGRQQRSGEFVDCPGPLTPQRIEAHLNGGDAYAVYNLLDGKRVTFALFDLDGDDKSAPWPAMWQKLDKEKSQALKLRSLLLRLGLAPENILVEFPTVGYHLTFFFYRPWLAEEIKLLVGKLLREAGLRPRPFYPHQVNQERGDLIRLPLRRNRHTGRQSIFVEDLAAFDPARYEPDPNLHLLNEQGSRPAIQANSRRRWVCKPKRLTPIRSAPPLPRRPRFLMRERHPQPVEPGLHIRRAP